MKVPAVTGQHRSGAGVDQRQLLVVGSAVGAGSAWRKLIHMGKFHLIDIKNDHIIIIDVFIHTCLSNFFFAQRVSKIFSDLDERLVFNFDVQNFAVRTIFAKNGLASVGAAIKRNFRSPQEKSFCLQTSFVCQDQAVFHAKLV